MSPDTLLVPLLVIGVVEGIAIASVMPGIDAGIRRLSILNM